MCVSVCVSARVHLSDSLGGYSREAECECGHLCVVALGSFIDYCTVMIIIDCVY